MKTLLRVFLTMLLVVLGFGVCLMFAPRLAQFEAWEGRRMAASGSRAPTNGGAQPDWGGGHLSADSSKLAALGKLSPAGVDLRQKPDKDYDLKLALPSSGESGSGGVFEVPSCNQFRKQLFPGAGDAEAPAVDIPLYPQSSCRMQVGQGTACFIGFYLTPDSIEAVRSYYVLCLKQLGWRRVTAGEPEVTAGTRPDSVLETFEKPDENRTVIVQLLKQDSRTTRIGLVAMNSCSSDRNAREAVASRPRQATAATTPATSSAPGICGLEVGAGGLQERK
ncbi:MAG TPA: hypothetical protein VMH22_07570 [bacterium]|nr:hypothetical protein [bacterium]